MTLVIQPNDWPTDEGLYKSVLDTVGGDAPQFHFIVTVQTHGPFVKHETDIEGHHGVHDYRTRLDAAAKSLTAFKQRLDAKGRPYALVLFGDHLPGLRLHQWKNGMKSETDPRLHQVPVLIASNAKDPAALVKTIAARPLYCFAPLMLDWIGQQSNDRYMNYAAQKCFGDGKADAAARRSRHPESIVLEQAAVGFRPRPAGQTASLFVELALHELFKR